MFAVTVCQSGPRLERSRPSTRPDKFVPNYFSLILIDGLGNVVSQSSQKSEEMFHTMALFEMALEPGRYTLVVDTDWQSQSPEFQEIIVKV